MGALTRPRLLALIAASVAILFIPVAPASAEGEDGRFSEIAVGPRVRAAAAEAGIDVGPACGVVHPIADADHLPFGVGPCPGVRPGAHVRSEVGGCTLNFMFKGYGRDEQGNLVEAGTFMGTAGHCILEDGSEMVWDAGSGPEATDEDGRRVGEFAYALTTTGQDFALVRLDPGTEADPQMCHFGGPTGIHNPNFNGSPGVIQHFGQGMVFGDTVSARSGVAYLSDLNYVFAGTGALFGDSGSGVETQDGRAIGVLVGISALGVVITKLEPQVEQARSALGLESLEIQTAEEI